MDELFVVQKVYERKNPNVFVIQFNLNMKSNFRKYKRESVLCSLYLLIDAYFFLFIDGLPLVTKQWFAWIVHVRC